METSHCERRGGADTSNTSCLSKWTKSAPALFCHSAREWSQSEQNLTLFWRRFSASACMRVATSASLAKDVDKCNHGMSSDLCMCIQALIDQLAKQARFQCRLSSCLGIRGSLLRACWKSGRNSAQSRRCKGELAAKSIDQAFAHDEDDE
eukprot:6177323-Pleurochrysis_carterae.AAC.6